MNKYTFKNDHDNKYYTRITKAAARAAFIAGKNIVFCPCNLRPFGFWHPEIITNYKDRDETETETTAPAYFDKLLNLFEIYNCRDNETGKYTAFYIAETEV